jgi:hypothetical protein
LMTSVLKVSQRLINAYQRQRYISWHPPRSYSRPVCLRMRAAATWLHWTGSHRVSPAARCRHGCRIRPGPGG